MEFRPGSVLIWSQNYPRKLPYWGGALGGLGGRLISKHSRHLFRSHFLFGDTCGEGPVGIPGAYSSIKISIESMT